MHLHLFHFLRFFNHDSFVDYPGYPHPYYPVEYTQYHSYASLGMDPIQDFSYLQEIYDPDDPMSYVSRPPSHYYQDWQR